ncbi:hypothetical protein Tco_1154109 [Tanacetum coccineum]
MVVAMLREQKERIMDLWEVFGKQNVSNRTTMVGWKGALSVEADLSGWDLRDTTNGSNGAEVIDFVIDHVFHNVATRATSIPTATISNATLPPVPSPSVSSLFQLFMTPTPLTFRESMMH